MTHRTRWLLAIFLIALSACSTGREFDRTGMQDTLHQRLTFLPEHQTTDRTENQPLPAGPFRLGVYFVQTEFPSRESIRSAEWLSAEKDRLVQSLAPLRDDRIIREIVVLAEPTVRTLTGQELRQAAARYGADMLLLVDGVGAVSRRNNAYALLYPTLLGAWLAPGTVIDALFIIDGVLWDLRTDRSPGRQTAEGQAQRTGAVVMVNDTEALNEAKDQAIDAFGRRVADRVRSLARDRDAAAPLR